MIYLDHAATTSVRQEVLREMLPYLSNKYFGNAGSIHSLGKKSYKAVAQSRQRVAGLINALPKQIIFTSGGTEANNLAILGSEKYMLQDGDDIHMITTSIEHDSVINTMKFMEEKGYSVSYVNPRPDGRVYADDVIEEIQDNTKLISIMYENNETGVSNYEEIVKLFDICKEYSILLHVDCVQALGSHRINVDNFKADMISMSSHKIQGSKGVGALYVRDVNKLSPIIYGGKYQEFGKRGGTENVAEIVGFGKACKMIGRKMSKESVYQYELKELFLKKLYEKLDMYNLRKMVTVNGDTNIGNPEKQRSKILNLTFKGIDAETLVLALDIYGVCISAGSACHSHENTASRVLMAMGISDDDARCSVRISFGSTNTENEVIEAAAIMATCVNSLTSKTIKEEING